VVDQDPASASLYADNQIPNNDKITTIRLNRLELLPVTEEEIEHDGAETSYECRQIK